jgi:hypothetical protein
LDELYDIEHDPEEKQNLAKESSFFVLAEKELDKHSIITNSFHILFPKKTDSEIYSGTMQLQGAIYKIPNQKEFGIKILSKRSFSFEFRGNNLPREMVIDTVHPSFEFSLSVYLNQRVEKFRVGKWGILNQPSIGVYPQILISNSTPSGSKNSDIPWIYNDAKLTGEKEISTSSGMGEEVRQILKSWGYIHE